MGPGVEGELYAMVGYGGVYSINFSLNNGIFRVKLSRGQELDLLSSCTPQPRLTMADKLRATQQLEQLQARYVGTGHADTTKLRVSPPEVDW